MTASNLKAAIRTDVNNPSKSLIKKICYLEACKFISTVTVWGCQHEVVFSELEESKSFCLNHVEEHFQLDRSHSYYYQVQCQLNICEVNKYYFLVWSPDAMYMYVEED